MSRKFNKKLAQKGGMMIEALAMLGLISVVTPTMYKKSAERTLEVEDINTATTMRSVMSATDSYVSAHYSELLQNVTDGNATQIPIATLQEYLPYAFDSGRLYDYNAPTIAVKRQGNSLTSFVLFPAKQSGEDGLGQERTVRIATLVGANGGYVNGAQTAKGIGGIWNLNAGDFQGVFGAGANPNTYSIVTASSDAINNTNTEEDTDKFLYRTDADGKWHNVMRTDLYLGGLTDEADDDYIPSDARSAHNNSRKYSIRDVRRLIIGQNSVIDGTNVEDMEQDAVDAAESGSNYGLYIKSNEGFDSAFIQGSLVAADEQLNVTSSALKFFKEAPDSEFHRFIVDGAHLKYGTGNANRYNFEVSNTGVITNTNDIELASNPDAADDEQDWSSARIGRLNDGRFLFSGTPDSGKGRLSLIDDDTILLRGKDGTTDSADRILIGNNGYINSGLTGPSYADESNAPVSPVRIGSNLKVDGVLSTPQVNTDKIRANSIEVGSQNLDDPDYKVWLKVDEHGIHGSNYSENKSTVFEVHPGRITLATGDGSNAYYNAHSGINTRTGALNMLALQNNGNIDMASRKNIDVFVNNIESTSGNMTNYTLTLRNTKVKEEIKNNDILFTNFDSSGNPSTSTSNPYNNRSNVKIKNTNLEVAGTVYDHNTGEYVSKRYLSVRGNNNSSDPFIKANYNGTAHNYDVAMHGRTIFTGDLNENVSSSSGLRSYMSIGQRNTNSAVNIAYSASDTNLNRGKSPKFTDILMVDTAQTAKNTTATNEDADDTSAKGTIYIRKGALEVKTGKNPQGFYPDEIGANEGYGIVKASRFVANNIDENGNSKASVPQFFDEETYSAYNGTSPDGRYDTYMVNPAYTSVMHDIKLTTRGGARLSDVLPDFINKGIYITSNTYKDNIKNLHFWFNNSGKIMADGAEPTPLNSTITLGDADSWASPYLGFVPAPQCPPGYNQLITLAPQSFMVANAGQLQKGSENNPRGIASYYIRNQVPDSTAFTSYSEAIGYGSNSANTQQAFEQATVKINGEVETDEVNSHKHSVKAKTGDSIKVTAPKGTSGETTSYVLVSYGDKTVPLTIQQSTWLKTNVVPVGANNSSPEPASLLTGKSGYGKGWAALMGFVYDRSTYQSVIDQITPDSGDESSLIRYDGSGDPYNNDENPSVFWNIFPVRRNTLEAYATVYCYFDRNSLMWNSFLDANKRKGVTSSEYQGDDYIDHYDAISNYNTNQMPEKEKAIKDNYRKRLNDPTMKYNEVW